MIATAVLILILIGLVGTDVYLWFRLVRSRNEAVKGWSIALDEWRVANKHSSECLAAARECLAFAESRSASYLRYLSALEFLDECRAALSIEAEDAHLGSFDDFEKRCKEMCALSQQVDEFLESVGYGDMPRLKNLTEAAS